MAKVVEGEHLGEPQDQPVYGRYDPRRLTGGAPLYPLVVLFGLNAVDELDRTAFQVLTPNIRDWFGLSLAGVGLLIAAIAPISLLLELPIAYLGDRRSRVKIAIAGGSLWGFFSVITGLAANVFMLGVARIGSSLGRLMNGVHVSLLSDYYPQESRARVLYAHRVANSIGQIVGPLAAGGLALAFTWRTPFVVFAIPTAVFIFLALRLRDPQRGLHERKAAGADDRTAALEDKPPGFAETFRILFQNKSAKRIYYSLPFFTASSLGFQSFISILYADVYRLNEAQRGVVFALTEPVQIVSLILGALIMQRVVNKSPALAMKLIGVAAVGSAAGLVIMALSPNVGFAIAGHLLNSFLSTALLPGVLTVISFVVPPRMRTLGFATGNLWFILGTPVLPLIGGIGDAYGIRAGMLIFVPVYLLGSFIIASAGNFIEADIKRVQTAARATAEARRTREEEQAKLLIVRDLDVAYDNVQVLFGVDFDVSDGEIVALLGTNGAGKSTLLKAISGLVPSAGGAIVFDGNVIVNQDPAQILKEGIAQIPGGRGIFPSLTVEENLNVASWIYRDDPEYVKQAIDRVLEQFPILRERWDQHAGSLSGGEQQMLSLAQAFIAKPKMLLIDELTLGLAPTIVERLLEIVREIHRNGTTIVLVEQSVNVALRIAERAVFLEKGEVRFSGATKDLLDRPDVLRSVFLEGAASATTGDGEDDGTRRLRRERREQTSYLHRPVVLESAGVSKRFGGIAAVSDVDLQLHDGEILGIIGPNGAGKTTLFDLLTGFVPIDSGRVHLRGTDVTNWTPSSRAKAGLGRSFQDARLWPSLTVKEAIAVAFERTNLDRSPIRAMFRFPIVEDAEKDIERRTEELIELLGLHAFRDKFISELSTGSRRIVEIATILAHRPDVLLLDEPSSGIAQKETEALGPLLRRVREYMRGSLVVIEHDMPLISTLADRIVALDLGRVIAVGTPEEVLNHPNVVESYLGTSGYEDIVGTTGNGTKKKRTKRPAKKATRRKPTTSRARKAR